MRGSGEDSRGSGSPRSGIYFLVGVPRSGTTLLRSLLGNHPEIAVSPELKFFTLIVPRWRKFNPLDQPSRREALSRAVFRKLDKFDRVSDYLEMTGQTARDTREVLHEKQRQFRERIEAVEPTPGSYFRVLVELFSDQKGPLYLVKTPTNLRMVPTIREQVPGAKFLWIHRDPRDVVTSMLHGKETYMKDVKKIASLYRHLNRLGLTQERVLGAENWLRVSFERLVRTPETMLGEVLEFMDLEARGDLLSDVSVVNSSFEQGRGLDPSVIGRYRDRLSPRQQAVVETIVGSTLTDLGYEPSASPLHPGVKFIYRIYGWAFGIKEEWKGFFKNRGRFHWIEPFFDV